VTIEPGQHTYETINLWKHKAKKKNLEIPGFHQLAVESCNKSATVTVAESVMQPFQSSGRIKVKTPKGYIFGNPCVTRI
jgi:hypothetical protein